MTTTSKTLPALVKSPNTSDQSKNPAKDLPNIFGSMEVGLSSHFLDSGSFSLWRISTEYAKEHPKGGQWGFYHTESFFDYMDAYARFIRKYKRAIDLYANVDVIPNPELTWRNQKYLEAVHALSPVPVVHFTSDLSWLSKYISKGYRTIALGGLVGSTTQDACKSWIDRAFDIVCDQESRLPKVNIHGFGVTSYPLLLRYPWWSVDSSSWTKVGAFGGVLVPHCRHKKWVFTEQPYVMKFSNDTPDRKIKGKHYETLTAAERGVLLAWLEEIGVPLGRTARSGEILLHGVTNRHSERKAANLLFFERMRQSLPDFPWAFRSTKRKGFF